MACRPAGLPVPHAGNVFPMSDEQPGAPVGGPPPRPPGPVPAGYVPRERFPQTEPPPAPRTVVDPVPRAAPTAPTPYLAQPYPPYPVPAAPPPPDADRP